MLEAGLTWRSMTAWRLLEDRPKYNQNILYLISPGTVVKDATKDTVVWCGTFYLQETQKTTQDTLEDCTDPSKGGEGSLGISDDYIYRYIDIIYKCMPQKITENVYKK